MSKYKWKTILGEEGIIEANNLLDLIKQVNLGLMNELGYHLDEFKSIEEMQSTMISVCEECRTQSWTMEDTHGNPITDHAGRDAYCFECDNFSHVIEIKEQD